MLIGCDQLRFEILEVAFLLHVCVNHLLGEIAKVSQILEEVELEKQD